jgi:hypothetical protein
VGGRALGGGDRRLPGGGCGADELGARLDGLTDVFIEEAIGDDGAACGGPLGKGPGLLEESQDGLGEGRASVVGRECTELALGRRELELVLDCKHLRMEPQYECV